MRSLIVVATLAFAVAHAEARPTEVDPDATYLYYLHGRIIEDAGPRPEHPAWGLYDYPAVLTALGSRGAVVLSEQRPSGTDIEAYAKQVGRDIQELVARGVPEHRIAVVGFSKGGAIATLVSAQESRSGSGVRFVLLGACPDWLADRDDLAMQGHVLTIFEASDNLTAGCGSLSEHQREMRSHRAITIDTGAEHGAFYLPREAWLTPTLDWVHGAR